jgi:hypothetical protein
MNPTITHKHTLGPLRWSVPSATTKGITYEVAARVDTGELVCNCMARRVCWHIRAVATGMAGKPRVRMSERPASAPLRIEMSDAGRGLADLLQV